MTDALEPLEEMRYSSAEKRWRIFRRLDRYLGPRDTTAGPRVGVLVDRRDCEAEMGMRLVPQSSSNS